MSEVEVSREGSVLTITLNRPDVLNAINRPMHEGLRDALRQGRGEEIRAVVLTGAGRGFCVGQDLTEFREAPGDIAERLRSYYHPTVEAIRSLEKPVIAAVNGVAAGAGLSLACTCDLRIASDSAAFVPAFIGIGLIPDSGSSLFIQRLLGTARAFDWMATNRKLPAAEAAEWGLVTEVVAEERFAAHVSKVASTFASLPTRAIGMSKRLFDHAATATLAEQLELEAQLQAAATKTADFAEGVGAFLEKREPVFSGR